MWPTWPAPTSPTAPSRMSASCAIRPSHSAYNATTTSPAPNAWWAGTSPMAYAPIRHAHSIAKSATTPQPATSASLAILWIRPRGYAPIWPARTTANFVTIRSAANCARLDTLPARVYANLVSIIVLFVTIILLVWAVFHPIYSSTGPAIAPEFPIVSDIRVELQIPPA